MHPGDEWRCAVWGVLNVTPDSFSDGGRFLDPARAVAHGLRMVEGGADVVDVGGESSRPAGKTYGSGHARVPADEERRRVEPVVRALVDAGVPVSVDTVKADVARAACDAGARWLNVVAAVPDRALLEVARDAGVELVLMHNRGRGEVAPPHTDYGDLVADVVRELRASVARAVDVGVPTERIWIDPGLGFAKTATQSLRLLGETAALVATGHPVLVGASRKSFLAAADECAGGPRPGPDERLGGSVAAVALAVAAGARAVRVHDVAESRQAVHVAQAALRGRGAGAHR